MEIFKSFTLEMMAIKGQQNCLTVYIIQALLHWRFPTFGTVFFIDDLVMVVSIIIFMQGVSQMGWILLLYPSLAKASIAWDYETLGRILAMHAQFWFWMIHCWVEVHLSMVISQL